MSNKAKALVSIISGGILLIVGCSKTSEDQLTTPEPGGCDTVNMTYSTDVQPILQANCYRCHGNGNAEGGVTLDTYESVSSLATTGILTGVITHASGFPPMPQDAAKLSDCDINKIQDWINRGATNN